MREKPKRKALKSYVTHGEYVRIQEAARKSGKSLSEWVREVALGAAEAKTIRFR